MNESQIKKFYLTTFSTSNWLKKNEVMLSSNKSSELGVKATKESVLDLLLIVSTWASRTLDFLRLDFKAVVNNFSKMKSFIQMATFKQL